MSERDLMEEIAVALKRIADALERMPAYQLAPYQPTFPVTPKPNPNQCSICGGFHGASGLPCPHLTPTATTTQWPNP